MEMFSIRQTPCLLHGEKELQNELILTVTAEKAVGTVLSAGGVPVWRGTLHPGNNEIFFRIPEPKTDRTEEFVLDGIGAVRTELHPPRHWEVHVVQLSHHDPGYTDVPSHVLEESTEFLKQILDDMDARDDYPEDSRYRITVEQTYSIYRFLRTASERDRARMIARIRRGDVEITALWANLISELLAPEEMLRAFYPAEEIARETGVPVITAEHNDIPGFSWGYCTALCQAGIRFFVPGLPNYYDWGGRGLTSFWDKNAISPKGLPGAFWWESAEGERILFWCNHSGCGGTMDPDFYKNGLLGMLENLEDGDVPYSVFRFPVQGADRDNSPYIPAFADNIREWNKKYAYPHIISSTEEGFYRAFTDRMDFGLPVFRGGVDGQDYPTASTCQMDSSALNRENHAMFRTAELLYTAAAGDPLLWDQTKRLRGAVTDMLMADEHAFGFTFPACPGQRASYMEHAVFAARASADIHDVLAKSMASIADRVEGTEGAFRLTVFHTSGTAGRYLVTAPLRDPDNCGTELRERAGGPTEHCLRICELSNRFQANPQGDYLAGKFRLRDRDTGEFIPYTIRRICWNDPVPLAGPRAGIGAGTNRLGLFEDPSGVSLEIGFLADLPACGYKTYDLVPCEEPAFVPAEPAEESIGNEFYRVFFDSMGVSDIVSLDDGKSLFDKDCPHRPLSLLVRYASEEAVSEMTVTSVSAEKDALHETLTLRGYADGIYEFVLTVSLARGIDAVNVTLRAVKNTKPLQTVFLCFPFAGTGVSYQGTLFEGKPAENQLPGSHSDALAVQDWVLTEGSDILWSSRNAPIVYLSHLWDGYISPAHRCLHDYKYRTPLRASDFDTGAVYSLLTCNNFGTNFFPSQLSDALFSYTFARRHGRKPSEWGHDVQSPMTTIYTNCCRGTLPSSAELLSVPGVRVLAFKPAEDGDGFILRLRNDSAEPVETSVSIWGRKAELCALCDALERKISPLSGDRITVPEKTLVTVRMYGSADKKPAAEV